MDENSCAHRAAALVDSVAAYFDDVHTRAVPKAKADLKSFIMLRDGPNAMDNGTGVSVGDASVSGDVGVSASEADAPTVICNGALSDRMINLVFKDHTLLRAAKQKRKLRFDSMGEVISVKKRAKQTSIDDEDGVDDEDVDEDEDSDVNETMATEEAAEAVPPPAKRRKIIQRAYRSDGKSMFFVNAYRWTKSNVDELLQRAKRHQSYLRSLRGRTWARLSVAEGQRVHEYIDELGAWIERLESRVDETEFFSTAIPLLQSIERLEERIQHESERNAHIVIGLDSVPKHSACSSNSNSVRILLSQPPPPPPQQKRSQPPPPPSAYATKQSINTIDASLMGARTAANKAKLKAQMDEMQALVTRALNLYGAVRGSGPVVERAVVPSGDRLIRPATFNPKRGCLETGKDEVDDSEDKETEDKAENEEVNEAPDLKDSKDEDGEVAVEKEAKAPPTKVVPYRAKSDVYCYECRVARIIDLHESVASCPKCADCVPYNGESEDRCAYDNVHDMESTKPKRNYDPKNYAMRWLRRVQGRLNTKMPDSVYTTVFNDLFRRRITVADRKNVRKVLQKNSLTDYYPMVPFIVYKFNEVPLPEFSDEEEVILNKMYDLAIGAYQRCPKHIKQRSNYLSVPYHFYQCVTIQGWLHYRRCFPLIDRSNLRKHDRTWRWMCNDIGWPFYATV